jgi:hypothetical protein
MHVLPLALLVTIRLYDSFGVPPGELQAATLAAEASLRSASVQPVWLVCPTQEHIETDNTAGCGNLPEAGELLVRIVRAPSATPSAETLGFASVDTERRHGTLATVYGDRVAVLAARGDVDRATLLGRAIAHEVGHLLLGTAAHARRGLMRPTWTVNEMHRGMPADWLFSRSEAGALVSASMASAAREPELRPSARAGQ